MLIHLVKVFALFGHSKYHMLVFVPLLLELAVYYPAKKLQNLTEMQVERKRERKKKKKLPSLEKN